MDNAGGTISPGAGSYVSVNGTTINGGTVSVPAAGTLDLNGGVTLTAGPLSVASGGLAQVAASSSNTLGGTVNTAAGGTVQVGNNGSLILLSTGTFNNAGTIVLGSTGNNTNLIMNGGTVTLSGGGVLSFSNFTSNRIYGVLGTETFVNANNTIQGSGQIGAGQLASFTNQGTVDSNMSAGITINPSGTTTNTGLMEATAGSTLTFNSGTVDNAGGTISAASASTVALNGVTINGGTFSTSGTGVIENVSGSALNGVTLSAGSAIEVPNNTVLDMSGTFINLGVVTLGSTGGNTSLLATSALTLTGGGEIAMTDSPNNSIYGSSGSTTIDNAGGVIAGAGQLGLGQLTFTNSGTVIANGSNPLVINLFNPFTNQGSLMATGTGGILYTSGNLTNNGTVTVASGSSLGVSGGLYIQTGGVTTLASGSLSAAGVSIQGGSLLGSGTLSSSVSNGAFLHPSQLLVVTGSLTLATTSVMEFDIGGAAPGTGYDTLSASSVSLGGSLDLVFANGYQALITPSDTFTLITAPGGISGQFTGLPSGSNLATLDGFGQFQVDYLATSVVLSNFQPVPEPPTLELLAGGALALAGALGLRRRRP